MYRWIQLTGFELWEEYSRFRGRTISAKKVLELQQLGPFLMPSCCDRTCGACNGKYEFVNERIYLFR